MQTISARQERFVTPLADYYAQKSDRNHCLKQTALDTDGSYFIYQSLARMQLRFAQAVPVYVSEDGRIVEDPALAMGPVDAEADSLLFDEFGERRGSNDIDISPFGLRQAGYFRPRQEMFNLEAPQRYMAPSRETVSVHQPYNFEPNSLPHIRDLGIGLIIDSVVDREIRYLFQKNVVVPFDPELMHVPDDFSLYIIYSFRRNLDEITEERNAPEIDFKKKQAAAAEVYARLCASRDVLMRANNVTTVDKRNVRLCQEYVNAINSALEILIGEYRLDIPQESEDLFESYLQERHPAFVFRPQDVLIYYLHNIQKRNEDMPVLVDDLEMALDEADRRPEPKRQGKEPQALRKQADLPKTWWSPDTMSRNAPIQASDRAKPPFQFLNIDNWEIARKLNEIIYRNAIPSPAIVARAKEYIDTFTQKARAVDLPNCVILNDIVLYQLVDIAKRSNAFSVELNGLATGQATGSNSIITSHFIPGFTAEDWVNPNPDFYNLVWNVTRPDVFVPNGITISMHTGLHNPFRTADKNAKGEWQYDDHMYFESVFAHDHPDCFTEEFIANGSPGDFSGSYSQFAQLMAQREPGAMELVYNWAIFSLVGEDLKASFYQTYRKLSSGQNATLYLPAVVVGPDGQFRDIAPRGSLLRR